MPLPNTLYDELLSYLYDIEKDDRLYEEKNFTLRQQAIDDLEFNVIDRTDALMAGTGVTGQPVLLRTYAVKLKCDLEAVDMSMFHRLRTLIAGGVDKGRLLLNLIREHLDHNLSPVLSLREVGYDDLDVFLNGLLTDQPVPMETLDTEPEMVFYQKTPARIILELVKKAAFRPDDVFFDLGSGLGQAVILVNLLTGIVAKGVEIEPAFCSYATSCAACLNLDDIGFINADARHADYSSGTIFFMYTPFEGAMLDAVMQKLNAEAKTRQVKIFTYGPCTATVAKQDWLVSMSEIPDKGSDLGEFISVP